jgi:hypothetical protein
MSKKVIEIECSKCDKKIYIHTQGWEIHFVEGSTCPDCTKKLNEEMGELLRDPELIKLGFVAQQGSEKCGCMTIPCMGGKMPYDKNFDVPCVTVGGMCYKSPVEVIQESTEGAVK